MPYSQDVHRVIYFNFQARMMGGRRGKNWPKKYNIDYFGYAVNLEFKFKLIYRETKFKIKSILGGFKKLSKLKKYRTERGGESRIHGNSIKSAFVLNKTFQ